jgi:hypothetical protein
MKEKVESFIALAREAPKRCKGGAKERLLPIKRIVPGTRREDRQARFAAMAIFGGVIVELCGRCYAATWQPFEAAFDPVPNLVLHRSNTLIAQT